MSTNLSKALVLSAVCSTFCATFFSSTIYADEIKKIVAVEAKVAIEVMPDAKVFAQFDQEIPAVVNYYTKSIEPDVVTFYRSKYGEPSYSTRLKGRLTQSFRHEGKEYRVIISQQNNMRQVDVLVTH